MRVLGRLGSSHARLEATVSCQVIDAQHRRIYQTQDFPVIEDGNFERAMQKLDALSRGRLIDAEDERELDTILPALRDMTRPGS
jgi:hypothetical protein